ncbi:hypothetical protein D6850_12520 [Roseovarius spongiae]|uniref:MAPEG family protein n=1 Tax=Roseovarius spongiae TaxID=2320272 RepID=A0A3A8B501_9RHOB|nr:hypothetical protein [Roseovarius spongiae]RKF13999.1 hypothetical protein D6850_12520 [Roseovarius spongiae]
MSPSMILWIAVSGAIFALWAFQMFRCLFALSQAAREAAAAHGGAWPSLPEQLAQFAAFACAPEHARDRRLLLILTALVLATSLIRFAMLSSG